MKTYFDTSVLLKSYIPEAGTPEALAIIRAAGAPFPFSHLLELELRTAIRIKHGRGEITVAEKTAPCRLWKKISPQVSWSVRTTALRKFFGGRSPSHPNMRRGHLPDQPIFGTLPRPLNPVAPPLRLSTSANAVPPPSARRGKSAAPRKGGRIKRGG